MIPTFASRNRFSLLDDQQSVSTSASHKKRKKRTTKNSRKDGHDSLLADDSLINQWRDVIQQVEEYGYSRGLIIDAIKEITMSSGYVSATAVVNMLLISNPPSTPGTPVTPMEPSPVSSPWASRRQSQADLQELVTAKIPSLDGTIEWYEKMYRNPPNALCWKAFADEYAVSQQRKVCDEATGRYLTFLAAIRKSSATQCICEYLMSPAAAREAARLESQLPNVVCILEHLMEVPRHVLLEFVMRLFRLSVAAHRDGFDVAASWREDVLRFVKDFRTSPDRPFATFADALKLASEAPSPVQFVEFLADVLHLTRPTASQYPTLATVATRLADVQHHLSVILDPELQLSIVEEHRYRHAMDEQRLQTQRRDRELRKSEIDAERWRLKRRIEDLEREISSCHARLAALDESEQKVDDALGSNDGQVADLERRFARDMERLSTPPETAGLIADVFASTVMVHTAASEAFLETMSKLELMLGSNGDELTKHDLESIRAVMLQLLSWVRAADQLNDSSQILEKRLHDLDTQTRLLIAKIDQLAHQ